MELDNDALGFGGPAHAQALTLLLWPATQRSAFTLHEHDATTTVIGLQKTATGAHVSASRLVQPVYARMRVSGPVSSVTGLTAVADKDALDAASSGYAMSADGKFLWIKMQAQAGAWSADVAY
jgi:hypothetical protein